MPELAKLYIGTSGWSYPKGEGTWSGHFYPTGRIDQLEYYSQFFNTVEINSSFYRPPNPRYAGNWAGKVPAGFLFTAKLWQKFTHPRMYQQTTGREAVISQGDVDLFNQSIEPLVKHGKLGALLAQFPPSFRNDGYGCKILEAVIKTFRQYPLAVELRHRSWSDSETTAQLLRENNVAWVQIDEPKFESSVAAETPVTADVAYFRFHGRNRQAWWQGNSETRYKYLYPAKEIDELANRVRSATEQTNLTFAFFNNHWQGYAPRNAVDMIRTLQLPVRELPIQPRLSDEDIPQSETQR